MKKEREKRGKSVYLNILNVLKVRWLHLKREWGKIKKKKGTERRHYRRYIKKEDMGHHTGEVKLMTKWTF